MTATQQRADVRWVVGNTIFAVLSLSIAVAWAWPIYASGQYVVMAVVSVVVGMGIAVIGAVFRLAPLTVVAIGLVFAILAGVPLAVPSYALAGVLPSLDGLGLFASGTVTAWRQLATVATLPVGAYQALLVPAFLVFLVVSITSLSLSLRSTRFGALGAVIGCSASLFGAVFGFAIGSPVSLGIVTFAQGTQLLLGLSSFVVTLIWLSWRLAHDRAVRLARFGRAAQSGRTASTVRRITAAAGILVVTLLVGGVVTAQTNDPSRSVLRTHVTPVIDVSTWQSPLSSFRSSFTDGNYDKELFTVSGLNEPNTTVDLAVLNSYDGSTFHVGQDLDGEPTDRYQLLPGSRTATRDGDTVNMEVTVDGYQGIWVPTVGSVTSATFAGNSTVNNALFVGTQTDNLVSIANRSATGSIGIVPGDTYAYTGIATAPGSDDEALGTGAQVSVTKDTYPQLVQWRDRLTAAGYDLSTLAGARRAIALLTNSGYLSHAVDVKNTDGTSPKWTQSLGGPAQSSRAGHSTERIETLFRQLNDVGSVVPSPAQADSGAVSVAAIGDDEQFSTAAALLLQSAGKQSRVVVGFIPENDGSVRGRDMRAWVQALLADGTWANIATTPQSTRVPTHVDVNKDLKQDPATVQPVLPQVEPPSQADPASKTDTTDTSSSERQEFAWILAILRPLGIGLLILLVLLAPPIVVLLVKRSRRKDRRARDDPRAAIIGGWDELVDRLADTGAEVRFTDTRRELVRRVGAPETLAVGADRAAFSADMLSPGESSSYWDAIDDELERLWSGQTRWAKLKSALSTASFMRYIKASRDIARAKRRPPERG